MSHPTPHIEDDPTITHHDDSFCCACPCRRKLNEHYIQPIASPNPDLQQIVYGGAKPPGNYGQQAAAPLPPPALKPFDNPNEVKQIRPEVLIMWTKRDKCFMCKHRFEKPFILPVDKPQRGAFQPNFNIEAILHLSDTHGIPDDVSRQWIVGSIYGMELGDLGVKELGGLFRE